MQPARFNLNCWEGDTYSETIAVLTGGIGSPAKDLTGYTSVMNLRTAPDTVPVYTLSTVNGQITLGGVTGTITLYIPAADTLTFGSYEPSLLYDLGIALASPPDSQTLLWGQFRIRGVA